MSKSWLTIGLVCFLLAGCAESTSNNEQEAESEAVEAVEETNTEEEASAAELEVAPSVNTATTADQSQVALNPPHGEPGHDCAIAVGAPLNGSGSQVQQQPITAPVATQPVAQPNFSSSVAPADGLNPPHGQPGHDCAVAVGAPLPKK